MLKRTRPRTMLPTLLAALVFLSVGAQPAEAARLWVNIHFKGTGTVKVQDHETTCSSSSLDHRKVGASCKIGPFEDWVNPVIRVDAIIPEPSSPWRFAGWDDCNRADPGAPNSRCRIVGEDFGDLTRDVTVRFEDHRKPNVTSLEGTAGTVHHGSANFSYVSDEPGTSEEPGTFVCRLSTEADFLPCPSGAKSYSGLPRGQHTFEVKAVDPSGNVGLVAQRSWTVDFDVDGDGFDRDEPGARRPVDCDDAKAWVNPDAWDTPDNGIDENCDGRDAVNLDRDRDGYERSEPGAKVPFDCDDAKAWINPGAGDTPENGVDENCDGRDAVVLDRDGDGYDRNAPGAKAPFDCDDAKAAINPGAVDAPRNEIDENCDGRDADYPSITSEVRYAAHRKGGKARIRRLSVIRPPDGAMVTLKCRGKGCTFKRRRQVAAPGTSELSFAADLRKTKLRRGAVVEVWITRSGMRGKMVRLKVGRGAKVSAQTLCVEPGSKKPGGCPAG
jgi:hypothetical protein